MKSVLIIGQSNMAGRGFKEEVEPIVNDRLFVLRNGRWWKMYVPVNPDRVTAGICLAESFAELYSKERDTAVGIIPCADGGTCIDQWEIGGVLFDHACYMAELAARSSEIVGILWHQGESDCTPERCAAYEEKLSVIIDGFRARLNLPDVPFIVGGLGDFLVNRSEAFAEHYEKINEALMNISAKKERVGFVSAKGLGANPDNLHFSAKALREFGVRYYEKFIKLENRDKKSRVAPEEQLAITELEKL